MKSPFHPAGHIAVRLVIALTPLLVLGEPTGLMAGTIYFTDIFFPTFDFGSIRRVNTDGTGLETLIEVGGGLRAIDVDVAAGKIYWSDVNTFTIRRANLDGTEQEIVVEGVDWASSLVLDSPSDSLYWGDQVIGTLERSTLDGSDPDVLTDTAFHIGIDIDPLAGKLYWSTSIDLFTGDLVRSNLDGTGVETVITDMNKPARLLVDAVGGRLYWTDYVIDVIRSANTDGSDIQTLFVVGSNLNPRGITLDRLENKLYWGQDLEVFGYTGKIMRIGPDGSNPEDVLQGGLGLVNDLVVIPSLTILEQPQDLSVKVGQPAVFTVVAAANESETIHYLWHKDGQPLSDGGTISGTATDTLTINPAALADAGDYEVIVSTASFSLTSDSAHLETICPGDANRDGLVDPLDSGFVQSRFGCIYPDDGENCLTADVNEDGLVDPLDTGYILSRLGTCG